MRAMLDQHGLKTVGYHIGGLNTLFYTLANGGTLITASMRAPGPVCEAIERPDLATDSRFIKNADRLSRDTYGVILCDEAHTALGDRTSAAIRRLDTPTYIGMTATDELLQKHVGDVFPAEIADFPLAEAVLSGVVAPLRAVRVPPGSAPSCSPLTISVHDPQTPCSHPRCVPVSPKICRRKSPRCIRTGTDFS